MKINIGKIILIIVIFFIMFFIFNKIFVVKILQEVYDVCEEYNKDKNLNLYSNVYIEYGNLRDKRQITEKYVKDGNVYARTEHDIENNNLVLESHKDAETNDYLLRTLVNKNEDTRTYEIADSAFGDEVLIYPSYAVSTIVNFNDVNILKKLYIMFCKNNLMYLENVEDKWCYVISVTDTTTFWDDENGDTIENVYKVWIDINTLLPVKEEYVIDEKYGESSYTEYEYKFDVVTDDDIAWPDLSGKDLKMREVIR